MSSLDKFQEEKKLLFAFRNAYPEFPKGRILKSESPDFILHLNPTIAIGIELTGITYRPNEAGNPQTKNKFTESLFHLITNKEGKLKLYRKKNLNFYWLIISFDSSIVQIGNNLKNHLCNLVPISEYHRIFLFDFFKREIIILK